jgi:lipoate-protein ligase A
MPIGGPGTVIFAQSLQPYVSHGVQQFASETFDLATCERLAWPIVRRPLPGGAEYCDVNQLLFQWVSPVGASGVSDAFIAGVLTALHGLGIAAEHDGRGQFVTNGARLGTLATGRIDWAFVLLGCLYLSYDPQNLARVSGDPRLPETTSLWAEATRPLAPDMLQGLLIERLAIHVGQPIERDTPRQSETRAARRIEQELLGVELAELQPGEADLSEP